MRELKFRAWSKKHNKYLKITGIQYDGDKFAGVFVVYGTIAGIPNTIFLEPEDVILEQYTGLKDKNDKEVYEGDIVDYNDDGECIGVVEYDAPEFYLNADATNWARMFLKGTPHQKVIGNIHENPELLGEKE